MEDKNSPQPRVDERGVPWMNDKCQRRTPSGYCELGGHLLSKCDPSDDKTPCLPGIREMANEITNLKRNRDYYEGTTCDLITERFFNDESVAVRELRAIIRALTRALTLVVGQDAAAEALERAYKEARDA